MPLTVEDYSSSLSLVFSIRIFSVAIKPINAIKEGTVTNIRGCKKVLATRPNVQEA